MRVKMLGVALLLIVATILGQIGVAWADDGERGRVRGGFSLNVRFRDEDEAAWAAKFITKMQMQSVIRGYEDLTFRPNQPVNRQEAVAMVVRAIGLEQKARQTTVYSSVYRQYQDYANIQPWARGYVQVALDLNLLDTSEVRFQPLAAASRIWVVPILVKAMGLQADAQAAANAQLTFRDAAAIPGALRGYVAIAVNTGLVAGYPDNTFRPDKPVTRAEMAKVLDILQGNVQPPQQQPQQGFTASGVIAAVYGSNITVAGANNTSATYQLASNAFIYVDDRPAAPVDLKAGMRVDLFLDVDGRAVFVDAKTARAQPSRRFPRDVELRGTVAAVDAAGLTLTVTTPDGRQETVNVAETATIEIGDDIYGYATLADVQVGDAVQISLRGGVAVKIEVKNNRRHPGAQGKEHSWRQDGYEAMSYSGALSEWSAANGSVAYSPDPGWYTPGDGYGQGDDENHGKGKHHKKER